jgi:sugar O-acyltransferase (sialic acid O-acetyltransferase NeuD family)
MKSVILGAGLYGEVYYSYLKNDSNYDIIGFLDDDTSKSILLDLPVFGKLRDFNIILDLGVKHVFCPIGENAIRRELLSTAYHNNLEIPNFIHSGSHVSKDAFIGKGIYVLPGAVIMPYTTINDFCMISMGTKIAHHTTLEEGSFVSTGANIGASIHVKENVFFGMGCTVMTGVKTVGSNSTIGAGAVVIRDVPDNAVMAGVPAKVIRYKQ